MREELSALFLRWKPGLSINPKTRAELFFFLRLHSLLNTRRPACWASTLQNAVTERSRRWVVSLAGTVNIKPTTRISAPPADRTRVSVGQMWVKSDPASPRLEIAGKAHTEVHNLSAQIAVLAPFGVHPVSVRHQLFRIGVTEPLESVPASPHQFVAQMWSNLFSIKFWLFWTRARTGTLSCSGSKGRDVLESANNQINCWPRRVSIWKTDSRHVPSSMSFFKIKISTMW